MKRRWLHRRRTCSRRASGPISGPTYFGAIFLDLDGHRIEVLTNAN
jgi:hypothetical protein